MHYRLSKTNIFAVFFCLIFGFFLLSNLVNTTHVFADTGVIVEASFKDRAHIEITKITVTDDKYLNPKIREAGYNKDDVNRWINKQLTGEYFDSNTVDSVNTFKKDSCGGQSAIDASDTTGVDDGSFYIRSDQFKVDVTAEDPSSALGCKGVLFGTGRADYPTINERDYRFSVDTTNNNIWFYFAANDTSHMVRADNNNDDGSWTVDPNDASAYNAEKTHHTCNGGKDKPYVHITGPIGDSTPADYMSCAHVGYRPGIIVKAGSTDNPGGGSTDTTAPESCESKNSNVILGWLLCSVIGAIDDTMSKMVDVVDNLLDVQQDEYNVAEYKVIWSYMKNIADFLLVGAALVIIIGQAMRGE